MIVHPDVCIVVVFVRASLDEFKHFMDQAIGSLPENFVHTQPLLLRAKQLNHPFHFVPVV
ncbi:hypothetical protein JY439_01325 [Stenotrophomonas maltophilia]|jgi:hypothetical protein|nr:hypothetical protein [Stenotrophomonas maltophilia]